jgi:hypothetical protein
VTILRFRVQGTVESRETGRPLAGLIVRAYDEDLLFDDYLGASSTDERGRFLIEFTEDAFRDFAELDPDLYLQVYDSTGERMLHRTPVHRNIGSDERFRLRIPGAEPSSE